MRERIVRWLTAYGYFMAKRAANAASMAGLTTNPFDARLGHGPDSDARGMNEAYLVLSEEERAKGFVRPLRTSYIHELCGAETVMTFAIAQTYARDPVFYGATYCARCRMHRPVGPDGEFVWPDGTKVGV